ncbi:hypothetical protein GCM10017567_41390 [Amycolatopsis bullii]|uniref:Uncharacterized protein n=1 Tax=Amycolatopsis bullii TaxID=941987 RepID=A0ABQ3KE90_9PSEU|nr:hypothetical protein GCM10017567_41390 [Amycolatopsis bullii]
MRRQSGEPTAREWSQARRRKASLRRARHPAQKWTKGKMVVARPLSGRPGSGRATAQVARVGLWSSPEGAPPTTATHRRRPPVVAGPSPEGAPPMGPRHYRGSQQKPHPGIRATTGSRPKPLTAVGGEPAGLDP